MLKNLYKLKQKINISAKTIDNKLVLGNSFIFMSTLGLPFDILLDEIYSKGFVIDWVEFCQKALNDGWKKKTILSKLNEAIYVFDKEYSNELLKRVELILENM